MIYSLSSKKKKPNPLIFKVTKMHGLPLTADNAERLKTWVDCSIYLFTFCEFTDRILESYAPLGVHPHQAPPLFDPALCRQGVAWVDNIGKR